MASVQPSTPASRGADVISATNDLPTATEPSYQDASLSLGGGAHSIKDEDIITVVQGTESLGGYKILSLRAANKAEEDQQPFHLEVTLASILPTGFLDRWLFKTLPPHLQDDSRLLLLASTRSGTGLALKFLEDILKPVLEAIGLPESSCSVIQTKNSESVKDFGGSVLLPAANSGKKQTVVMLSGDGGIVDLINALSGTERPDTFTSPVVCLFPLGTGNALFHSLHRPASVPSIYIQGLRTLLNGAPKTLPIFQARFSEGARLLTNEGRDATPLHNNALFGAVVASYGLHSTLVGDSDTTEYRKHGDKRFGMAAKNLLFPDSGEMPHEYQASVVLQKDREEIIGRDKHGYLLITLVSNLEQGFTISPDSTPLDGQLRMIHFGPLSGKETMDIMGRAYDGGKHVQSEGVGYEKVDGARIIFKEKGKDWKWRRVCIDGSIVAIEEDGWLEVTPVRKGYEMLSIVTR